jgi:hypothetical protein
MYFATKSHKTQILVWLIWVIACLVFLVSPESGTRVDEPPTDQPMLAAVVADEKQSRYLFPWQCPLAGHLLRTSGAVQGAARCGGANVARAEQLQQNNSWRKAPLEL